MSLRNTSSRLEYNGVKFRILSRPSKMPGYSFSLPAKSSCPGARFDQGDICDKCYATRGRYMLHKPQQEARLAWTKEMIPHHRWRWLVTRDIEYAVAETVPFFRIHDSGDFFSPEYVDEWTKICQDLPGVHFWAPTRSYNDPFILDSLRRLAALPNVAVRPSAMKFDDRPPTISGLHCGSGAFTTKHGIPEGGSYPFDCPSRFNDGKCGTCRFCWKSKSWEVYYHAH